jgi:cytochrome oxidase Cu insertion factor (SCO1/SenC/PrrC family)
VRRRTLLLTVAAVLAVASTAVAALVVTTRATREGEAYRGSPPPKGVELAPFALRSYRGGSVSSSSLRGKVVALTFLESKCREACPVIAFEVARGVERLRPAQREQVRALAISTHPADDTPASVRAFLAKQRAVEELEYLVGSEGELRPIWRRFNVLSALDSGDANTHSASVHVYDRNGVWVSTLHPGIDLTTENLAHDLALALGASR